MITSRLLAYINIPCPVIVYR